MSSRPSRAPSRRILTHGGGSLACLAALLSPRLGAAPAQAQLAPPPIGEVDLGPPAPGLEEPAPSAPAPDPDGPLEASALDGVDGAARVAATAASAVSEEVREEFLPEDVGAHRFSLPGLTGAIGLLRTSSADTGSVRHLRLAFRTEYFAAYDVIVKRDWNQRLAGTFALGYTPIEHLDLFAALLASSNRNLRLCESGLCTSEPGRSDPELIKSIGDVVLGGKYAQQVAPGLALGGELGLKLLASVSGLSLAPSATSAWFGGLGTLDLREQGDLPVRLHLNLGYYVDNSGNVQSYRGVSQASQLVSSFAFGIGRSRFRGALGVDFPFDPVATDVYLLPFAEYHLNVVTTSADANFAEFTAPLCGGLGARPCVDNRDQQWTTLGLRALLPGGFALEAAVDIGLRSVGFPYGPPVAPYNVVLGVSLPVDLGRMGKVRIVTRTERVAAPPLSSGGPTEEGMISGEVVSASGGVPVAGAIVGIIGRAQSRVASDPDGSFRTHLLAPGQIDLDVSAPDFEPQVVRAEVAAGMVTDVRVALVPANRSVEVRGRLTDGKGGGLAGRVQLTGPETASAVADGTGAFALRVRPGTYQVIAEATGYLPRAMELTVRPGFTAPADLELSKRPGKPGVVLGRKAIQTRSPIEFRGASDQLTDRGKAVLDEVAALLAVSPAVLMVDIEAHFDNSLGPAQAMTLTERRAEAVASYLRERGVAAGRLRTSPRGDTQPIVPNLGDKNRQRNRRIELKVQMAAGK